MNESIPGFADVVTELLRQYTEYRKRWVTQFENGYGYERWFCKNMRFHLPAFPAAPLTKGLTKGA
jgi:hypothetical protein